MDRVGQRFGDYRLKRLLSGRGAFADVYEGEHVVDRTKAAVKIWKVQIEAKIFLNDVRAAVLRHPHIVEILDFNTKGDVPYLVMAYAPNGSLQAQPLPLPLHSIVTYVRQIADALHYAHQRGIVHRDIKPDNILLGPRKEIWVGDFGFAIPSYTRQDTMPEEPEKRLIGTPDYMAPEQWEDQVSPASDQYALGVMVYEWLCGERPFRGNLVALYHKHTNEPPPPLRGKIPTISSAVEQVVMTALAKDPHSRFANVSAFANALEQACRPVPPVHPTTISPRTASLPENSHIVSLLHNPLEQSSSILAQVPDQVANYKAKSATSEADFRLDVIEPPSAHPTNIEDVPLAAAVSLPGAGPKTYSTRDINISGNGKRSTPLRHKRRRIWLFSLSIIIVVMLVAGFAIAVQGGLGSITHVIPGVSTKPTVTITPKSQTVSNTFAILAVTDTPDLGKREVAASILTAISPAESKTVQSSGSIPGTREATTRRM